ncbi:fibronectin type III domain-containing protein [uncultured Polaribacter sp.]|uniref:T9SS type A sorting domain-containing protein n=1 Tax=uncultured Polaribacter sp. TaxID=174711 RepID=UPI00259AEFD7|nr:fibronectin type III domain-containing protein [uncultured Polaribacter sp.]
MKTIILKSKKIIFILLISIVKYSFSQTTFTVTSTQLEGPGSFLQAIQDANANPGEDIIQFSAGLTVDAITPGFSLANPDMAIIIESVVIEGNGSSINAKQWWIAADGTTNSLAACPGSIGSTTIMLKAPTFLSVGTIGQDNSAITVTIKDLSIKEFNGVAQIYENATLNLENFKASDIWATNNCPSGTTGMMSVASGGSLSIKNSSFQESMNWETTPDVTATIISEPNAGNLTIENSLFYDLNKQKHYAINWEGSSSAVANIVSSRFLGAGGLKISGGTTTNIVNSTFVLSDGLSVLNYGERIWNNSNGAMNFIASSIRFNGNECNLECSSYSVNSLIHNSSSGSLNFKESAIGFNFPSTTGTILLTLEGSNITADGATWIEPSVSQDAAALKTITSQPNLLTDLNGFEPQVNTSIAFLDAEFVKPAFPGELIDVINTPLINPITNQPITLDPIGNDRFDGNGFRDIGAIQLSVVPFLNLSSIGNESATLNWNEPVHHDGHSIIRYEVSYIESSGFTPTIVTVNLPNLTTTLNGLTNGTEYVFSVRAVYDNGGSELNGPYSNNVTDTPFGTLNAPTLTATPGDQQIELSWNLPDLGGRTFQNYVLYWKESSSSTWDDIYVITDPNETTRTVSGLINGTSYEFRINARGSDERSVFNTTTATPDATAGIEELSNNVVSFYPNPVNDVVNIKLDESFKAKLFDINGKLILEVNNKKQIDISFLTSGMYFLKIESEDKIYSGKILKE